MSAHWKVLQALLVAALWVGLAGSQAQGQLMPPKENTKGGTLDSWRAPGTTGTTSTTDTSKSVDSPPSKAPPKKSVDGSSKNAPPEKKEKRGNTPPGMDRAGDGPAAGAIVDPSGVTTKK